MRVGQRIREVLAVAEGLKFVNCQTMRPLLPHIEQSNLGKYMRRAVGLGLMTIDRSATPHRFYVVPGWREMVTNTKRLPPVAPPPPVRASRPFALGQVWGIGR